MKLNPNTKRRVLDALKPKAPEEDNEFKDCIFLFDEGRFFWAYDHDAYILAYLFWYNIWAKDWPSSWFPRVNYEDRIDDLQKWGYSFVVFSREDKMWKMQRRNEGNKSLDIRLSIDDIDKTLDEIQDVIKIYKEDRAKENKQELTLEEFFEFFNDYKAPFQKYINSWNIKWISETEEKLEKTWKEAFISSSLVITKSQFSDVDVIGTIKERAEQKEKEKENNESQQGNSTLLQELEAIDKAAEERKNKQEMLFEDKEPENDLPF